jgi:hypothetical protein
MEQSHYPHYQTQPLGSPAPIIWYASLPDHVKRLYNHKAAFSQQPITMVVLAEVVCEAFTVWALGELFKKKNVEGLWKVLSDEKGKIRRLQDICDGDVNEIYTALSGDPITQAPFWEKLKKHSKRRNALVHPDHTGPTEHPIPSPQDSDESFKAVEDYIQHVHGILESI